MSTAAVANRAEPAERRARGTDVSRTTRRQANRQREVAPPPEVALRTLAPARNGADLGNFGPSQEEQDLFHRVLVEEREEIAREGGKRVDQLTREEERQARERAENRRINEQAIEDERKKIAREKGKRVGDLTAEENEIARRRAEGFADYTDDGTSESEEDMSDINDQEVAEHQQAFNPMGERVTATQADRTLAGYYKDVTLVNALRRLWYNSNDSEALAEARDCAEKINQRTIEIYGQRGATGKEFPLTAIIGVFEACAPMLEVITRDPDAVDSSDPPKRLYDLLADGAAAYTVSMATKGIPFDLYVPEEKIEALRPIMRGKMEDLEFFRSRIDDSALEESMNGQTFAEVEEPINTLFQDPDNRVSVQAIERFNTQLEQSDSGAAHIPLESLRAAAQQSDVRRAWRNEDPDLMFRALLPFLMEEFLPLQLPLKALPGPICERLQIAGMGSARSGTTTGQTSAEVTGQTEATADQAYAHLTVDGAQILTNDEKIVVGYVNAGGQRRRWMVEGVPEYRSEVGWEAESKIFGKTDGQENPNEERYNLKSRGAPSRGEKDRFKANFKEIRWVWSSPYKTRTEGNQAYPRANVQSLLKDGTTQVQTRTDFCNCLSKKDGPRLIDAWYDAKGFTKPWEVEPENIVTSTRASNNVPATRRRSSPVAATAGTSSSDRRETVDEEISTRIDRLESGLDNLRDDMDKKMKRMGRSLARDFQEMLTRSFQEFAIR